LSVELAAPIFELSDYGFAQGTAGAVRKIEAPLAGFWLAESPKHFAALRRVMPGISQKALTNLCNKSPYEIVVTSLGSGR
jgi:hypothetical protein